ncbi:hypothetical protein HDU96_005300, partial [Phlyctochytrium bullatum]
MVALAAVANAKLCLYNNQWWGKSAVVYDQYVQDWNACNYWNWHARNVNTFPSAKGSI